MNYKIDFNTGFYDNFEVLKEHKMFEQKYQYSTFKFDLRKNKERFKDKNISTLICLDNNKPIAWIRFDHEEKNNNSFQFNYVKRNFSTLGMFMIYVLPEYRNKGLASKMTKMFEEELLQYYQANNINLNKYYLINAVDLAYDLLEKNLQYFIPSHTFGNFNKNKQDLKGHIRFRAVKTIQERFEIIEFYK